LLIPNILSIFLITDGDTGTDLYIPFLLFLSVSNLMYFDEISTSFALKFKASDILHPVSARIIHRI